MGTRRKGREAALQMLYQMDVSGVGAEDALRTYWTHLTHEAQQADLEPGEVVPPPTKPKNAEVREFAEALIRGVAEHRERIDETIRKVSHHWRLERMMRVDRNILRLATYELLEMDDIPRRVTLNEAIELAKRFGAEGSPGFVNGVLDRIATDVGKE